jgi:hypothetical protein
VFNAYVLGQPDSLNLRRTSDGWSVSCTFTPESLKRSAKTAGFDDKDNKEEEGNVLPQSSIKCATKVKAEVSSYIVDCC